MKAFALALLLTLSCAACGQTSVTEAAAMSASSSTPVSYKETKFVFDESTTFTLYDGPWKCSSTAVGEHTFLTAAHCLDEAGLDIKLNTTNVRILRAVQDGNDHILVLVDGITFTQYATVGPVPSVRSDIHYWGNPADFTNMFRKGYIAGEKGKNIIFDVNGYKGDSGAGVFGPDNRLFGVISYIYVNNSFSLMGAFPLNFTNEQLAAVGMTPNPHLTVGPKVPTLMD